MTYYVIQAPTPIEFSTPPLHFLPEGPTPLLRRMFRHSLNSERPLPSETLYKLVALSVCFIIRLLTKSTDYPSLYTNVEHYYNRNNNDGTFRLYLPECLPVRTALLPLPPFPLPLLPFRLW